MNIDLFAKIQEVEQENKQLIADRAALHNRLAESQRLLKKATDELNAFKTVQEAQLQTIRDTIKSEMRLSTKASKTAKAKR